MPDTGVPALEVRDLRAGYGDRQVLEGVSLTVGAAETVALLGHNGAGKSTLLKAIYGLLPLRTGRVVVAGSEIGAPSPREMREHGVVYVPQGNRVFGGLSVAENLTVVAEQRVGRSTERPAVARTMEMIPELATRGRDPASALSGGEKQMLALAMSLIHRPRLLLVDEPSLGLAPAAAAAALQRIRDVSGAGGTAVLVVEQRVRDVLRICSRAYVLRHGGVSFHGSAIALTEGDALLAAFL